MSERITLEIEARLDRALAAIQRLDANVQRMGNSGAQAGTKTEVSWQRVVQTWDHATNVAMKFGGMAKNIGAVAVKSARLAMQTKALRANKAFGGLAKDFNNIETATRGMINQMDMVGPVNKALAFGIDMSNGKLAQMTTLAQKASIVMGTDIKSSLDDMMTAMGRGSIMIADNLGATFKLSEAYDAYAAKIGTVSSALTDQQKKLAFSEMFLGKLEKAYEHLGKDDLYDKIIAQQKRLEGTWTKLESAVGTLLGGIIDAAEYVGEKAASAMSDADDEIIKINAKKIEKLKKQTREYVEDETMLTRSLNATKEALLRTSIEDQEEIIEKYKKLIEKGRQDDIKFLKNKGDLLGKIFLLTKAEMKLKATPSVRFNANYADIASDKDSLQITKFTGFTDEQKARMKAFRDNKKARADARAEKIRAIKSELEWKKVSQLYTWQELHNLEKKLALAKAITAEDRLMVEITFKKERNELNAQEADEKLKEKQRLKHLETMKQDKAMYLKTENEVDRLFREFEFNNKKEHLKKMAKLEKEERDKKAVEQLKHEELVNKYREKGAGISQSITQSLISKLQQGEDFYLVHHLATMAQSFGNDMIMDGIKTMWMGTAKNSLFPGLGVDAMAIGAAEIVAGGALMGGAGVIASNNAPPEKEKKSGAKEKNEIGNGSQEINMNVKTSLFGSKTEARVGLNNVMRG